MNKYFEIFKFNLKSKLNFKLNYIFTLFSFTIHVLVFNTLWDFILKDKTILGYTKPELIWYIIIGEFIIYTTSHNYKRISYMIKSGDIVNLLVKPVSMIKYILAEELTCVINLSVNLIFACILGVIMAGIPHITLINLIVFLVSSILGISIWIGINISIGLFAFITEENEPFYLILSKGVLILVLTPLEFFPNMIQKILLFIPTTYVSYPASKNFVHFNVNQSYNLIIGQLIFFILIIIFNNLLSMKGERNINVNGG